MDANKQILQDDITTGQIGRMVGKEPNVFFSGNINADT